jgi:hypothetical protein
MQNSKIKMPNYPNLDPADNLKFEIRFFAGTGLVLMTSPPNPPLHTCGEGFTLPFGPASH